MSIADQPLVMYRFSDGKFENEDGSHTVSPHGAGHETLHPPVALRGWPPLHQALKLAGRAPLQVPACAALAGTSCFGIDMVIRVDRGRGTRMHLIHTHDAFLALQQEPSLGWRLCGAVDLAHAGGREAAWREVTAARPVPGGRWVSVALVFTGDDLVLLLDGVVVARRVFRDAMRAPPTERGAHYEIGRAPRQRRGARHAFHGAMAGLRLWRGVPAPYRGAIAAAERDGVGALDSKHRDLGRTRTLLGSPVRPEQRTSIAGVPGRMRTFERGALYWSRDAGARAVHGVIHDVYRNTITRSRLGWPISEQAAGRRAGVRVQRFQHGAIFWSRETGTYPVHGPIFAHYMSLGGEISDLGLPVDAPRGSRHEPFQDFQGGRIHHAPGARPRVQWEPSETGADARTADPGARAPRAARRALIEPPAIPGWTGIPGFRRHGWWRFGNFRARKLSRAAYAATFRDVPPVDPEHWIEGTRSDRWASIFYELAYKGVAAGGHSFGLAVAALHAFQGTSCLSAPIHRLTPSRDIRERIGAYHGYQLGAEIIDWVVTSMATGQAASPRAAFDEVEQRLRAGTPVVLCMYDLLHDRGHSVLAYGCARGVGGDYGRIYVADPNLPWATHQDEEAMHLRVHADDTFCLAHRPPIFRSRRIAGDLLPDTLLLPIPGPVLAQRPRAPIDEIREDLDVLLGGLVLLTGEAEMEQIRSGSAELYRKLRGRQYIVRDAIPGLIRVPRFDAAPSTQLYAQRGPLPDTLELHIKGTKPRGGRYGLHLGAPCFDIHIEAPIDRGDRDRIALCALRSKAPQVAFEISVPSKMARVHIHVRRDRHGRPPRSFALDLPLTAHATAVVQVEPRGGALRIRPPDPPRPIDIAIEAHGGAERRTVLRNLAPAASGEALRIRARDWLAPDSEILIEP